MKKAPIVEIEGTRRTLVRAETYSGGILIETEDGGSQAYALLTREQGITFAEALLAALRAEQTTEPEGNAQP